MTGITEHDGRRYVELLYFEDIVSNMSEMELLKHHDQVIIDIVIGFGKKAKEYSDMVCLDELEESCEKKGKTLEYHAGYEPKLVSEKYEAESNAPPEQGNEKKKDEPEKPYEGTGPLEDELKKIEAGQEEDITEGLKDGDEDSEEEQEYDNPPDASAAYSPPKKKRKRRRQKKPKAPADVTMVKNPRIDYIKKRHLMVRYPDLKETISKAFETGLLPNSVLEELDEKNPKDASTLSDLIIEAGGEIDYKS